MNENSQMGDSVLFLSSRQPITKYMKNLKQRKLLLLLTFLTLFIGMGRAQESTTLNISEGSITFTDAGYTQAGTPGVAGTGPVTITGTSTDKTKTVTVTGGEHVITLEGMSISLEDHNVCAFSIEKDAKVTLILKGENMLRSRVNRAGLQVASGAILDIKGDENGSLKASGGDNCPGIGGQDSGSSGTIKISGGKVAANGGWKGAGIGNGFIIISGGNVTAEGNSGGAGIGGGLNNTEGNLTLTGGTITTSSINADVIVKPGSGATLAGTDDIKTTTMTANHTLTVEENAALTISTCFENNVKVFVCGTLELGEGGSITNSYGGGILATQNANYPPIEGLIIKGDNEVLTPNFMLIGGGTKDDFTVENKDGIETVEVKSNTPLTFRTVGVLFNSHILVPDGVMADITLNGADIKVSADNVCAFSIANGAKVTLILKGENTLESGKARAGLQVPEGAELEIKGDGSLMAKGGGSGAGIGGGSGGSGGTITISGGVVTAKAGSNAFGIGGGRNNTEGYLTLTGGTITTPSINADVTVEPGSGTTLSGSDDIKTTTITANHTLTVEKGATLTINTSLENKIHGTVYGTLLLGDGGSIINSDDGGILATKEAQCPQSESIIQQKQDEVLTDNLVLIGGGTEGRDFTIENSNGIETVRINNNTPLTFRTPWPVVDSHILVPGGVTADITLEDYKIGGMKDPYRTVDIKCAPIELSEGAMVTLRLLGRNILYGAINHAAIQVHENSSLTIKGEGYLFTKGGYYAAGIGGAKDENSGTIRIESGTIETVGGDNDEARNDSGGAGIGGGGCHSGNAKSHTKIIITGGHVVARAGKFAYGIGTGRKVAAKDGAEINILGGYVEANECGAAKDCGTINICGGTMKLWIGGTSGKLSITGGSVKGGISDNITQSPLVYLLTLEGIASTVNSVSVDDTPYYIDQGYPDDENKDKLYLYVPKETEKVYVREDDAIATYSVEWPGDTTPTATRDKETSTPSKKPTLSFSPDGYTATVGDKEYKITDITVAEAGSGSAPTTASLSGQLPLNSVSVKLTDQNAVTVYESRTAASVADGNLSEITLNFSDQYPDGLPAGTYTLELQYGGDATWQASDVASTTLTVEKKTLAATDFNFAPPTGGSPVYDGIAKVPSVTANWDIADKIGEITLSYYKKSSPEAPQPGVPTDVQTEAPSLSEAIDVGTYTVKITVAEGSGYKATTTPLTSDAPNALWQFTITPLEVTVTPDAGQILFDNGASPDITYTQSPAFVDGDVAGSKISITGKLSFEKQEPGETPDPGTSTATYRIINPSAGGLALAGDAAGNYTLKFSDTPVLILVRSEAGADKVEALFPAGVAPNESGWINQTPFTLTAPEGFTFEGNATEYNISGDGKQTYTLVYKESSYDHTLHVDATAPVAPAPPSVNGLSATFTLTDATSGISSYTVSEGETVIASYPAAIPEVEAATRTEAATPGTQTGPTSLSYTYTGTTPGSHTLQFSVTDMAGNTLPSSAITFTLTKPADPDTPGNPDDPGIPEDPSIPDDPDDPDTPVDPDDPVGPVDPDPVANGQVAADATQVWTSGAVLHIHLPSPEAVAIYTFTGRLYKAYSTLSDDTALWLPQGNYIVVTGGERFKVQVGR